MILNRLDELTSLLAKRPHPRRPAAASLAASLAGEFEDFDDGALFRILEMVSKFLANDKTSALSEAQNTVFLESDRRFQAGALPPIPVILVNPIGDVAMDYKSILDYLKSVRGYVEAVIEREKGEVQGMLNEVSLAAEQGGRTGNQRLSGKLLDTAETATDRPDAGLEEPDFSGKPEWINILPRPHLVFPKPNPPSPDPSGGSPTKRKRDPWTDLPDVPEKRAKRYRST